MDENEGFLASQGTDISIKTLLENAEYFAEFIWDKLCKNNPSNICETQPLKIWNDSAILPLYSKWMFNH